MIVDCRFRQTEFCVRPWYHSEDQQQKDTILLNYCIDDIEGMCKVDSILSQGFAQFCQALGWAWSEVGLVWLVLAWSAEVLRIIGTGVDLVFVMVMGVLLVPSNS